MFLAHSPANLLRRKAFGLCGWIIAQSIDLAHLLVGNRGCSLAVTALIYRDYDGTAEAEVVLQAVFGVFNEAVVGPAPKVPGEFSALGEASCSYQIKLAL